MSRTETEGPSNGLRDLKNASLEDGQLPTLSAVGSHVYPPAAPNEPSTSRVPLWQREGVRMAVVCWSLAQAGWSDATTGPLIPTLETRYSIGYLVVSVLFLCNFAGFGAAGLLNPWQSTRFNLGINAVIGAVFHLAGFAMQSSGGPYGLYALAFVLAGYGSGLQDAQLNGWVAGLPNASLKMSIIHACYGALGSPLAATGFVDSGIAFNLVYTISVGIAVVNLVNLIYAFRFRGAEAAEHDKQEATLRDIMRIPLVHVGAAFYLVYVGLEVTLGGWTVSYLIQERGAPVSAGYVSSGFFGGLTLGRILLIPVTKRIGERTSIFVYGLCGVACSLIVWLVPNYVAEGVFASLLGFFLGPMYPVGISVLTKILPRRTHTAAVGWFASIGQAGSALFPFATGALAGAYGVKVLQPVCIALLTACLGFWSLVPIIARRTE